ncbi:MAG: aspartyl/asparaginyl beta-hydroxylase domain-containing protein [Proteobacteria bacterium]|nr:aspartyl/asparaginyl beta-hydroxylase domain-containing protein [Pseudomonadota bacterium]
MLILLLVASFAVCSMFYVYRYRGTLRYANVREYMRKAWPIFAPLNCLLYLLTRPRARHVFMDLRDFPELADLQQQWPTIRQEALQLYEQGYFERTKDPNKAASFDIGFRTFFKYGWSKFYLRWYGHTHESAQALCPKTVDILRKIPSVNGAMFSVLPPGSQLTRHLDPLAISLRYHLGLATPNQDACFIEVDGQRYSWRDGDAALFDITYLHHARNDTNEPRLILMCDVERPMNFLGQAINFLYKGLARLTVVPNIEGDKQGFANRVFASVAPAFARTKALKKSNRKLYNVIKYAFNTGVLGIVVLAFIGIVWLAQRAF